MRTSVAACLLLVLIVGCKRKPDFTVKVLSGATTITEAGAAPINDSIIVVQKGKIRAVGSNKDVAAPQSADRTDLTGEWIIPAEGSRIEVGEPANLIVLKHAPNGIEPANPADVGARLEAGEWKMPGH